MGMGPILTLRNLYIRGFCGFPTSIIIKTSNHRFCDQRPLNALNPVSIDEEWVNLPGVNGIAGDGADGPDCVEGLGRQLFPTDLYTWDIYTLRTVLDIFTTLPPILNISLLLLEGYPVNRVQAVPVKNTAYPDRSHNILASPLLHYPPSHATLDQEVGVIGRKIRSAIQNETVDLSSYDN
jgi:hypothetical protein